MRITGRFFNIAFIVSLLGNLLWPFSAVAAVAAGPVEPVWPANPAMSHPPYRRADESAGARIYQGPALTPTPEAPPTPAPPTGLQAKKSPYALFLPLILKGIAAVSVSPPPAPGGVFVSVVIEPSRLLPGQSGQVLIYAAQDDGSPVPDGTRVDVEAGGGTLSAAGGQTREGLLQLKLTAEAQSGAGEVRVRLGAVSRTAEFVIEEAAGNLLQSGGASPPFDPAEVIERVRNPVRRTEEGAYAVTNPRYSAEFGENGVSLALPKAPSASAGQAFDGRQTMAAGDETAPFFQFHLLSVSRGEETLYRETGAETPARVLDNEIFYRRSAVITESYRARNNALQQRFTLSHPPAGKGELRLEVALETNLNPLFLSAEEGLLFFPPEVEPAEGQESEALLRYTGAIIRDAAGREIYAGLNFENNRLQLTAPADWLDAAAYPVEIDPMIGDPILVSDPRAMQDEADVAYNAAANEYLVVWSGYDTGGASKDIEGQRVAADGTLVGGLISVAAAAEDQTRPAAAYNAAADEYLVLWTDYRTDPDGDVYGQRVAADGTLAGSDFAVGATEALQDTPDVACNADDNLYLAVWRDRRGPAIYVYGQVISGSGALSGTNFALYNSHGDNYNPRVSYSAHNREFLAVWSRWRDDIYGKRLSGSGALLDNANTAEDESTSAEAFVINNAVSNQMSPAVAAAGDGSYLVVWRDRRNDSSGDIYGQRLTADGALSGSDFVIAAQGGVYQTRPDISYNAAADLYLAVWRDDRSSGKGIYSQLIRPSGVFSGGNQAVYDGAQTQDYPRVAANTAGGYLSIWRDWRDATANVYARRIAAAGAAEGNSFSVGPVSGKKWYAEAAFNPVSREYLLVWEDYRNEDADIYGQRLSETGEAVGSNFQISNPAAGGEQLRPRASSAGADGYLVVWEDRRQDSAGDIYGQRLAISGTLAGGNFVVAATGEAQGDAALAYNPAQGAYLAVWRDERVDSWGDIYGQFISAGGVLSGSHFIVSAYPSRTQDETDAVYNAATGEYLVVWRQWTSSDNFDLYGQRLSGSGARLDNAATPEDESEAALSFTVSSAALDQGYPRAAVSSGGRYLIVWQDERNYSSASYDIYGQIISPGGVLSGTDIVLSADATYQRKPVAAALGGGQGFLVSWINGRDGDWKRDLMAQRVTEAGILNGPPDRLIENTGWLNGLAIAAPSAGPEALVAWEWYDEIYALRYSILKADFQATPVLGSAPLEVTFSNLSTPTNEIQSYEWNFGDGATAIGSQPLAINHVYTQAGVYTVSLRASGEGGENTLTRAEYIIVNPPFTVGAALRGYWHLDEESGRRYDSSGRNNTLAEQRPVASGAGQVGQAADFERDNSEYLSIEDTAQNGLAITGSLTLMGWAKPESSNSNYMMLAAKYQWYDMGQRENAGYRLGLLGDNRLHFIASPDGTANQPDYRLDGVQSLGTGTWHHVAAVFDAQGKKLYLYVDGQLDAEQSVAFDHLNPSDAPFMLGANLNSSGEADQYFDGELDDWRVYARALSGAEIEEVMQSPVAAFSALPQQGFAPLEVSFSNVSTNAVSYRWNFGDGETAVGAQSSVNHIYAQPGSYTVTLQASDGLVTDTLTRPGAIRVTGLEEGLQGYWRLNESGGLRADSSPRGNDLSDHNTVSSAGGQVGPAADFERGNSEYLSIEDAAQSGLAITGSLTLAGWFRPESVGNWMLLAGKYEYGVKNRAYRLALKNDGHLQFVVSDDGLYTDENILTGNSVLQSETWYHGAAVFDAKKQTLNLYLNGQPEGSKAVSFGNVYLSTAPFMLGADKQNGSVVQYFDGRLDEWRVYNRALSQAEIQTLTSTTPPAANFSAAPLSGTAPLSVTFTNLSTPTSEIARYNWDFGDGATAVSSQPSAVSRVYTRAGVYTVSLRVDGVGGSAALTKSSYITVNEGGALVRNWRRITTTTSPPVVGEGTMAYDAAHTQTVLYGGNASGWPYEDETWAFDGSDWMIITPTRRPAARYGAGMAYDGNQLVLFGGSNSNDAALNQTWVFSDTDWTQFFPAASPLSRTNHAMVYASPPAGETEGGRIYLFGGNDNETYYNDLWVYQNNAWQSVPITGTWPPPRALTGLAYASPPQGETEGGRLLLFGGRSPTGTVLSDTWRFDPDTETWTKLSGNGPPARCAHTLTYDPEAQVFVLAGGAREAGDVILSDTWTFGSDEGGWVEAAPATALPPMAYHRTVYNSADHALILFGNGEVWKYE